MEIRNSFSRNVFNVCNVTLLTVLSLSMLLPFLHVIAKSFSSSNAIIKGDVIFWPVDITFNNYQYVFSDVSIWKAFGVSVFITTVGTLINLIATATFAYPLSRPEYMGRKYMLMMVLFTMIFSAPLIPTYLVIKSLHLVDTIWVMIIPGLISAFNFFVMRSFFADIPGALIDSARIDGCSEGGILVKIVLPLSKPAIATMAIFYGVSHWNSYQTALYYLNDRTLYPLQLKLRQMIVNQELSNAANSSFSDMIVQSPEGIQMATVIVATVPILLIYPLLQRHFTKGMMIGSLKE
ncbi:carbohydrate ABC transporter permease [Paenibacillus radicis (ex Xue et al. 2023)]|uniref:Carbohydrate ABC transporter permease n=1 Tax=Paenibacillus radicis (ex Xue et al. 2023) TaxID=2972489 RepID=A0ABT1YQ58_9BACL|nr:carbohydrate ABC transporter permease [Paenibacillus radicis (ex Xue et al. 2023)]MCR8635314.1 carbohydrate ABC transporter permease [Paenibacillus radicis (ex Xue et al. 2023)]